MLAALVLYDVTDTICARKKRFILNVGFIRYYLVIRTMLAALVLYDVTDTICARKKRFILNVGFIRYYLVIRKVCHK